MYKQNLELISQNKTLLAEINNKTEYTKTLEQLFIFILDFFSKKGETGPSVQTFSNAKSADVLNSIIEKSKDLFKEREVTSNNNFNTKQNLPMLTAEESVKFPSIHASPSIFPRQDMDHSQFNFDLFDNSDMKMSRRGSGISTPKLLIEDYMNVTNSPATSYNESKFADDNKESTKLKQNEESKVKAEDEFFG